MGEFDGRLVVVTGGAGALGFAVVSELIGRGARVAVPAFDKKEAERLERAGLNGLSVTPDVDLSDADACERFYASLKGGLFASVHIAGGFAMGPIEDVGAETFNKLMAQNVASCYHACRSAVARMRSSDPFEGGRIVNVAARNALFPELGAKMVAYTASKAAVGAITQALGAELASERIWVNAVAPSTIDTPVNRDAMPDADHDAWPSPAGLAKTICFLASPQNETTRSAIVPVYGRS